MTNANQMKADFAEKAAAGDGQFAIAYAVLQLADEQASLRRDLCLGTSVGEGAAPGVLEMLAIQLGDVAKAVERIADQPR